MKYLKVVSIYLILMLGMVNLHAQEKGKVELQKLDYVFHQSPENLQLYPRNKNNKAQVIFSGEVFNSIYNSIKLTVTKDNGFTTSISQNLYFGFNQPAYFNFSYTIDAELADYDFVVELINSSNTLEIKEVNDVVCGDVILITGQSNAFSWNTIDAYNDQYSNKYCRAFGTTYIDDEILTNSSKRWSLPSATHLDANNSYKPGLNGFTGGWGLKLQNDLCQELNIPICIINGAKGGTGIALHFPNSVLTNGAENHEYNLYNALKYRTEQAKVKNAVKAIFWYQGEDEGNHPEDDSINRYETRFDRLKKYWESDYPNLEGIYVFQINKNNPKNNFDTARMREIQRQLAMTHSNVHLISTMGMEKDTDMPQESNNPLYIHYNIPGQKKLANRAFNKIMNTLYNVNQLDQNIFAPHINNVYKYNSNTLILEFDRDVIWESAISATKDLRKQFFNEYGVSIPIVNHNVTGNRVILNIEPSFQLPCRLTYLPDMQHEMYFGPWIKGTGGDQVEAFSFYNVKVKELSQMGTGWEKLWSNYDNGNLDDWIIGENDIYKVGDFNGDGKEELFCAQKYGSYMALFDFDGDDWDLLWSNFGNPHPLLHHKQHLIVGNFDGGNDEFIGHGVNKKVTMFKFINNDWVAAWDDAGNHELRLYREKLVAGDFDGDGKDEVLGCDLPNGWTTVFHFANNDFTWGWSDYGSSNYAALRNQRSFLQAGDFNGDGKDELIGVIPDGKIFEFNNSNAPQSIWSSNLFNYGPWALSITDQCLIGDIDDTDNSDELLFIQRGASASMVKSLNLTSSNTLTSSWGSNIAINDWPISTTDGMYERYLLIKTHANEPKKLLAFRGTNCNGLKFSSSLYESTSGTNKKVLNPTTDIETEEEVEYIEQDLNIYPNPNNGQFSLELDVQSVKLEIQLVDLSGRLVENRIIKNLDMGRQTINLFYSNIPKGVYFIRVKSNDNEDKIEKIIIN